MLDKHVIVKDDNTPTYEGEHLKDEVSSMIMDIKMPPYYDFRQGNTNIYNLDLNRKVPPLSSEFRPHKLLTMKIQQKNHPNQNVNYNQMVNLGIFFNSGRDTVDYGYSLYSGGNPMAEEELNSLSRVDKGDVMNINLISTEIASDVESTRTHRNIIYTESTEIYKYAIDAENTEVLSTTASYEPGVSIHLELSLH